MIYISALSRITIKLLSMHLYIIKDKSWIHASNILIQVYTLHIYLWMCSWLRMVDLKKKSNFILCQWKQAILMYDYLRRFQGYVNGNWHENFNPNHWKIIYTDSNGFANLRQFKHMQMSSFSLQQPLNLPMFNIIEIEYVIKGTKTII